MPDVKNLSGYDTAADALSRLNLVPTRVNVLTNDVSGIGKILGTRPEADNVVSLRSTVEVAVGAGPPIPGLVGMPIADAEKSLQNLGFDYVKHDKPDGGSPGTVVSQYPAFGATLEAPGQKVQIGISPAPAAVGTQSRSPMGSGAKSPSSGGKSTAAGAP